MTDTPTPPVQEWLSDEGLADWLRYLEHNVGMEPTHRSTLLTLRELQSRRSDDATGSRKSAPQPTREAVEAAREIIDAHRKGAGYFIDWLAPRAVKVARALLSSPSREEVIEECAAHLETLADEWSAKDDEDYASAFRQCAKAVRVLKSKPSSSE